MLPTRIAPNRQMAWWLVKLILSNTCKQPENSPCCVTYFNTDLASTSKKTHCDWNTHERPRMLGCGDGRWGIVKEKGDINKYHHHHRLLSSSSKYRFLQVSEPGVMSNPQNRHHLPKQAKEKKGRVCTRGRTPDLQKANQGSPSSLAPITDDTPIEYCASRLTSRIAAKA